MRKFAYYVYVSPYYMNIFENDQATKRTSHWDDDYQEEDAQICSSPLVMQIIITSKKPRKREAAITD